MHTTTINIPVSIPVGMTVEVEQLKKKLTWYALRLIQSTDAVKEGEQRETPYYSSFVRGLGREVDFSDMPDEREAYRKHLLEKYA